MKQIVFLISALVVLLQLHSTTASTDSQTGWGEIKYNVMSNTDGIKDWVKNLVGVGVSAWKDASVEAPEKWGESLDSDGKLLDEIKTKLSELIDELSKTAPVEWNEVKPEIVELVTRIFFKIREFVKKIVDAASGTQQERDDSVSAVIEALEMLLKIETINTENILREAAQKKLNTEQTDTQTGWDKIDSNLRFNTDMMKGRLEKLKEIGETAWKVANAEAPAKWAEFLVPYIKLMDKVKEGFSELISELRETASVEWEEIEPEINEIVDRITLTIEELAKIVAGAASGTEQKIDDSVNQTTEVLTRLMETEPVNTENVLREAAQKKLNSEQTDSRDGWAKTKAIILYNTEIMNDWAKELEGAGVNAWKEAEVDVPAEWAHLVPTLRELLDRAKAKFSEVIDELRKIVSVEWAEFESKISEVVNRIFLTLRKLGGIVVDAASGTQQEIDDSVRNVLEESAKLIIIETDNTINLLREVAQKKLDAEQTADSQKSQENE